MATTKSSNLEALGLPATATDAEIKKRYKKLAFENHPDRNGGSPEAHAKFLEINTAYKNLTFRSVATMGMTQQTRRTRQHPDDVTFV